MDIELSDIRKDVQCPICLGIIRKTRTAMECLHRFCQECIDKSIRLGNNECPTCRKHYASRRALRDDPNFDAFIATLFKNIDKYEAEESAFHKEDEARKKQFQASIAQISQRQSEALAKRKSNGKEAMVLALPREFGSVSRRRSCRNTGQETSEAHENKSKRGRDSSSDEPCAEIPQKKRKKCSTTRPCSSSANIKNKNGKEEGHHRDSRGVSPGLAWGRGGARSNTRQGNNNQGASTRSVSVRNARLNKLVEYLGTLGNYSFEVDIHVKLISLDTKSLPNLLEPYLRCQPTLLAKQLREYVALNMKLEPEEVELLVSKGDDKEIENPHVQSLQDDETLASLNVDCISSHGLVVVLYGKSKSGGRGRSK